MQNKADGERLAVLETEVKNIGTKVNAVENAVQSLHGKFDSFSSMLTEKYVAAQTFNEYRKSVEDKEKSRKMEKILIGVITAVGTTIVTTLVILFIQRSLGVVN